jgi:hypothetical protein
MENTVIGTIQYLKDKNPDYIFLCASSGVPDGWLLKEAWKKAYPNEKLPRFYTIDPTAGPGLVNEDNRRKYWDKRIPLEKSKIIVYDDMIGQQAKGVKKKIEEYAQKTGKEVSVEFGPPLGISRASSFGQEGYEWFKDKYDYNCPEIVAPVVRFFGVNGKSNRERSFEGELTNKELREMANRGYGTLAGRIHHRRSGEKRDPSERKQLVYIRTLKYIGRQAGERLREQIEEQEAQKKKSLEQRVSSVVAIAGLVSSFFFLGSSITGNAIGNISRSSGSWLGICLFLVGIAGALFWFRSKKR